MGASERRTAIIEALNRRRQDTMDNLATEFGVTARTIRTDIAELRLSYPIETVRGRYGGCVKVPDWYDLNRRALTPAQAALLKKLAPTLQGEDLATMNSIISQFASHYR